MQQEMQPEPEERKPEERVETLLRGAKLRRAQLELVEKALTLATGRNFRVDASIAIDTGPAPNRCGSCGRPY